jgi:poly-gamma-glutamate synthesis protein (capsule biosynthesis protein)
VSYSLTVAATGDSLITRRLPQFPAPGLRALTELIHSADVRFTNLEAPLHDFRGFPQAGNKGTYVAGHPSLIEDLKAIGFNLYAAANNHSMDWGEGGLFGTMTTLDRAGVVYAGIGRHLQEARSPRYLEAAGGRGALLAAVSTFAPYAPAGEQRPDCQGRPGVNPLRFEETITLPPDLLEELSRVYREIGLGAGREFHLSLGIEHPDPPGVVTLFERKFRGGTPGVATRPHAADLAGHLTWIRDARRQADWVAVSLHAHETLAADQEQPAEFITTFCREAVDAGADIILGHGPHQLRGVDVYRGKPILYGLGNFIFQYETVRVQPADYYERLALPPTSTPADAFDARAVRGGFPAHGLYWESVVAMCRFESGELADFRLYPITLGHGRPRSQRGTPVLADEPAGREIIERVTRLSPGVRIEWDRDGFGRVSW